MYVASDGDGVFQSSDGGLSWSRVNAGLTTRNVGLVRSLPLPEGEEITVAAGTQQGMFAKSPTESAWRRVVSDDLQIMDVTSVVSEGNGYLVAGASDGTLLVSSADPSVWKRVGMLPDADGITSVAGFIDKDGEPVIVIGTASGGLFLSDDLGQSFRRMNPDWPARTEDCLGNPLPEAVEDLNIRSIRVEFDDSGQPLLFVNTWFKAVLVSTDLGETWEWRGSDLVCDEQADKTEYAVPHYRNLELTESPEGDWFLAAFDGLYRSQDEGHTWHQLETLPVFLVRGMGVSPANGNDFRVAVTTYGGGAYFSDDLGDNWVIANKGLLTTRLADIEFSPNFWNDGKVIVGEKEHLPSLRADGEGWIENDLVYRGFRRWLAIVLRYHAGLPASMSTDLLLSEFEWTQIWPMQLAFSPNYSEDETIFIGHRRHGVWWSSDGGEDWERDWDGEIAFITALAVSPDFQNDRTVLAAMRGAGIYKTDDGGRNWRLSNTGFRFLDSADAPESSNFVIDRPLYAAMKDVLLVVSPDFGNDQTAFASSAEGLFQSRDGGDNWAPVPVSEEFAKAPVTALGISPDFRNDRMLLVSFKGRGLGISRDGGASVEVLHGNLLQENWELRLIEFSPNFRDDGIIIGATEEDVLVSRDRGVSWRRISRPVRYEDWRGEDRGPVEFSENWERELDAGFSGPSQAVSTTPGSRATLRFNGPSVSWLGERGPDGGKAKVYVDGSLRASIDLYAPARHLAQEVFSLDGLGDGPHVIEIEVHQSNNPQSGGYRVTVDALDIAR